MKKGVQKIYREAAHRYDLINRLMTLGLDVRWRKRAASAAAACRPQRVLDVCCGTADLALEMSRAVPPGALIIGADFSLPMLRLGSKKPFAVPVKMVLCDVLRLPFPSDAFDCLGIAFATRNLNHGSAGLDVYLMEFLRVLKPGGTLIHLETSQPPAAWLRTLFHAYVRHVVKPLGARLSGSLSAYRYLAHTIPRFCGGTELTRLLVQAGFDTVDFRPFLFHIAALHTARKPPDTGGVGPDIGTA
jgi:demethylmenaquinone methyltransferase/2-methoxy-6-polyprenyl-1,4-benzoquinol methylase